MKKKTLFLTLALTMAMSMSALTGCGNQAETTNKESTAEEKHVVVESADTETAKEDTSNNENDIIRFDDSNTISEYILDDFEFEDVSKEITASSEIPVYSIEGICVGYIKEGATVTITQHGINSAWYRFKNPVSGTDYDYLYVIRDYVEDNGGNTSNGETNEITVTKEMVKDAIENSLMSSAVEHTILDSKPSDMEGSVTVKVGKNNSSYAETVENQLYYPEDGSDNILNWSTYYIEFTNEDDTSIEYKVYYKDAFDLDQLKEDYQNSQNQ